MTEPIWRHPIDSQAARLGGSIEAFSSDGLVEVAMRSPDGEESSILIHPADAELLARILKAAAQEARV